MVNREVMIVRRAALVLLWVFPTVCVAAQGAMLNPIDMSRAIPESLLELSDARAVEEMPEAENIDLKEVVEQPRPTRPESETDPTDTGEPGPDPAETSTETSPEQESTAERTAEPSSGPETPSGMAPTLEGPPKPEDLRMLFLLGKKVPAKTSTRLEWVPGESFAGIAAPTPVLVLNGAEIGPVLCLTAAVHGDELNGIEVVRRIMYDIDVEQLNGTLVGVPIVNMQGFQRSSRYLADRRDLNRHFPGHPEGSAASRIAYSFFEEIVSHCDALVDLHTGSFYRTNLPQIRADLKRPEVKDLSQQFGATVVLHSSGSDGTLRRAATEAGVPAVTIEAGEPHRLQEEEVSHGVKGIRSLLDHLGMYEQFSLWGKPEPLYYESEWIRADNGGILLNKVSPGDEVKEGDVLGTVTDPITNARNEIRAPFPGRVLGQAVNQVVMPGFAAYRLGTRAEPSQLQIRAREAEAEAARKAAAGASNNGERAPKDPGSEDPGDMLEDSEE